MTETSLKDQGPNKEMVSLISLSCLQETLLDDLDKLVPLCEITTGSWAGADLVHISLGPQQTPHHDHFWGIRSTEERVSLFSPCNIPELFEFV